RNPREEKMELANVLHMTGGIGDSSYARNSLFQGLIEEEKVNSFNVPLYCPSPAEIKYIVEKEGSFTIDLLKTLEHQMDSCEGYNEAQSVGAFAQPLLVRHFGDDNKLMDVVFNKCRDIYANIMAKE
ncbi:hypothetical protein AABB24_022010, partial [Solanum stoloniferum]